MSCPVRVQLLGPVRASNGDRPVSLRGKTARTVLARLALSNGSVVGVDQLADALWEDDPPLEPSVSLRSIISRLRAQLGREAIVTEGDGYRLDTGVVQVDLATIEDTLKNLDPGTADPAELSAALDVWNGEALTDVAWTPFFEPERTRIEELRARLTDCCHEAMLRSGRAEQTLADLERDAAASPLRESTQLLLMRALGACGRTADALRSGEDYRRRLIDQTGLNPSPEYDAVAHALLADNDDPQPSAARQQLVKHETLDAQRLWIPPDTPFVGRQGELDQLAQLMVERRLVTITGPGGVGKTRLITECAGKHPHRSDGAIDMVGLASLDRNARVDTAVAAALGIEVSSGDTLKALCGRLAAQTSVLVLDNCEHVLSGSRLLVEQLLRDVKGLKIVCTSRRRLGLADEAILDVGPLELPVEQATNSAPVLLFLDRVIRAAPGLTVSENDLNTAADICRLLDGLPLALELAAARVAMLGFDGLRQRLLDGLAVPSAQVADDYRRQATIESTVDWSLALLTPSARDLFDELAVFPSWLDLAALEEISDSSQVVDTLSEIIDSSLVVIDHERPAYRLLEPVRQVTHHQLDDERREHITERYVQWVASIVDAIHHHWISDDRPAAQQLIIDHRADLRWSLTHFIERRNTQMHGRFANVLARALVDRADIELIERCRADAGPSLEADLARCMLAWHQGDLETARLIATELESQIDPDSRYWGYYHWARTPIYLYSGEVDKLAESASLAANDERGVPYMRSEAVCLWALGLLYSARQQDAIAVLAGNEAILRGSACGGFVAYTRAEVVAGRDPELALTHLSDSSREAIAAQSSFTQRLTDVSQLVLLVAAGRVTEAADLALRLLPELIRAGTYPQAWTAMRHLADLLGQLETPDLGILTLDSANADAAAPAVVGDAAIAEKRLRHRLQATAKDSTAEPEAALPPTDLWERLQPVLEQVADEENP